MSESDGEGPVTVTTRVEDGRTIITADGSHDMAVIVHSESGERIYLPPEEPDDGGGNPYRPAGEGPYEGIQDETPYGPVQHANAEVGMNRTPNGFRIVHEEPVTDVRVLQ